MKTATATIPRSFRAVRLADGRTINIQLALDADLFGQERINGPQRRLFDEEDGRWVTVHGRHVLIRGGIVQHSSEHSMGGRTLLEASSMNHMTAIAKPGEPPPTVTPRPPKQQRPQTGRPQSLEPTGGSSESPSGIKPNLFGQAVVDPIKSTQSPLFHEPTAAPVTASGATAADARIAKQYDPTQTPKLPGISRPTAPDVQWNHDAKPDLGWTTHGSFHGPEGERYVVSSRASGNHLEVRKVSDPVMARQTVVSNRFGNRSDRYISSAPLHQPIYATKTASSTPTGEELDSAVNAARAKIKAEREEPGPVSDTIPYHQTWETSLDTAKGKIRISTTKLRDGHYVHDFSYDSKAGSAVHPSGGQLKQSQRTTDASMADAAAKHTDHVRHYIDKLTARGDSVVVGGDLTPGLRKGTVLPAQGVTAPTTIHKSIYDVIEKHGGAIHNRSIEGTGLSMSAGRRVRLRGGRVVNVPLALAAQSSRLLDSPIPFEADGVSLN